MSVEQASNDSYAPPGSPPPYSTGQLPTNSYPQQPSSPENQLPGYSNFAYSPPQYQPAQDPSAPYPIHQYPNVHFVTGQNLPVTYPAAQLAPGPDYAHCAGVPGGTVVVQQPYRNAGYRISRARVCCCIAFGVVGFMVILISSIVLPVIFPR